MIAVHRIGSAVALIAALVGSGSALAQPKVLGKVLTNREGLTLYTFDNDVAGSGKSVCNAPCSGIFPPYLAEPDARPLGDHSIILRDDGSRQWAYKGKPLYLWFDDKQPGDTGGDGMNRGIWHVATP